MIDNRMSCLMIFIQLRTFNVLSQTSGGDNRVSLKKEEVNKHEWLFPETTKNFNKLPLQYKVIRVLLFVFIMLA